MRTRQFFQTLLAASLVTGAAAAAEPPSWRYLLSEAQGGLSKPEYYHFALSFSEQAIVAADKESAEKGLNNDRLQPYLVRSKAYDALGQPDKAEASYRTTLAKLESLPDPDPDMLYTALVSIARFDASHGAGKVAEKGALRALALHPRVSRANALSTVEPRAVLATVYLDRRQPRLAGLALSQDQLDRALSGSATLDVLAYAYTVEARRLRMVNRTAEAAEAERTAKLRSYRLRNATNVAMRTGNTARVEARLISDSCTFSLPDEAKAYGLEGSVSWTMAVAPDGTSKDHVLSKGSGHKLLDEAAGGVVPGCRFTPATENGVAVAGWARVMHTYSLNPADRPAIVALGPNERCLAKASFLQVPDLIEGNALTLHFLVDTQGVPYDVKVEESEGDLKVAQQAVQAMQGCRFGAAQPALARRSGTIRLVWEPPLR